MRDKSISACLIWDIILSMENIKPAKNGEYVMVRSFHILVAVVLQ